MMKDSDKDSVTHCSSPANDATENFGSSRCSTLRFLSECKKTSRGFQIITFNDASGEECELQQSSAIDSTERGMIEPGSSYIWLGIGQYAGRMHLHREHVQELVAVLQGWLKDGKLDA